jgi:Ni,Fe-hydrogenase III small subunit/ferredoxin-like protein FixX
MPPSGRYPTLPLGCAMKRGTLDQEYPIAAYGSVDFFVPVEQEGDGCARLRVLFAEAEQSAAIIGSVLSLLPEGAIRVDHVRPRAGATLAAVEAPLGAAFHWLRLDDDGKVIRYRVTPPSFTNWHGFHLAAEKFAFQDFPIILATFGLSNAECDRWRDAMANRVLKGFRTGIKSSAYPARFDDAPGISPGRPSGTHLKSVVAANELVALCPTHAIARENGGITIDQARCVHCFRCRRDVGEAAAWEPGYEWAVQTRDAATALRKLAGMFGRLLHVRFVDAGACGACMSEARQINNPYYNMTRVHLLCPQLARARR